MFAFRCSAARLHTIAILGLCLVEVSAISGCSKGPEPRSPITEAPDSAQATPEAWGATASQPTLEPPVASEATPSHSKEPARNAAGEIELDTDDGLDADIAALDANTKSPKAEPRSETAGRDIVYRVTPKGLVIELDGVHLRPEAKALKDKNGAYSIEIALQVESFDGRQYRLKKPNEGPLSLAGKIEDKAGKAKRFSDERHGDGEELVTGAQPRTFRQRWPGKGQPRLGWGQTLTLEVGLWGIKAESERERPVRRLFEVKMIGGNKPQAVLTPPTLDWGN